MSIGPKIKFYLFAIAYLPTLLLPTQFFFFCFSRSNFFFFAVSIFQFQSVILNLYKLKRKTPTGIAFIPHFLSLFFFCDGCLIYLLFNVGEVTLYSPTNLQKKNPDVPTHSLNT